MDIESLIQQAKREFPESESAKYIFLFEFSSDRDRKKLWERLYHPDSVDEIIWPYEENGKYLVGFHGETPIDLFRVKSMYEAWVSICEESNGNLAKFSFEVVDA